MDITDSEVFTVDGPINLDFFMKYIYAFEGYARLKYPPFKPWVEAELTASHIFHAIADRDRFFYHPYDSFDPIVHFLEAAAEDKDVLAIKQTLYRVSGQSPVVSALALAAERGKQVTVLLELKARFDEENNIHWGQKLEKAGCHVIYGLRGLKTHSKIILVVRRESGRIVRYTHLGTGNYNDVTAASYTDMGLLTANPLIGQDASDFFNMLSTSGEMTAMKYLTAAPHQLRPEFLRLIKRERDHALAGRAARIRAKMNALVDPEIIEALYQAGQAGVKIELLVRGICCLQPAVKNVSENIAVHSIIGRFLEHARVYHFANGGTAELYLSSADWMPRNLDRRVELLFPVLDANIYERIMTTMEMQWADTAKAWNLKADAAYERLSKSAVNRPYNAQEAELLLRIDRSNAAAE
jgi:polyphosphate kinase